MIGGVRVTSDAALRRFFVQLATTDHAVASASERSRSALAIEAELDAAGLGPDPRKNQ
jgi:hypothetical protein